MSSAGLLPLQLDGAMFVRSDENLDVVVAWFGGTGFNIYNFRGEELDCFTVEGLTADDWREAREAIMVHLEEMREGSLQ